MTFTLHECGDDVLAVPDDRSIWAFVFGGFWLVWHGAWIVGALWITGTVLVQSFAAHLVDGAPELALAAFVLTLLPRLWLLLEGAQLRRWSLKRRGYRLCAVVEADDAATAEDIFVWRRMNASARTTDAQEAAVPERTVPTIMPAPKPRNDTFGLVPMGTR